MGESDTVPGFGAELGQVVGVMLLEHAEGLEGLRQDVDKDGGGGDAWAIDDTVLVDFDQP